MTTLLTAEQQQKLDFYIEKWKKKTISTEPLKPKRIKELLGILYKYMDLELPEVLFFEHPLRIIDFLIVQQKTQVIDKTICLDRKIIAPFLKKQVNPDLLSYLYEVSEMCWSGYEVAPFVMGIYYLSKEYEKNNNPNYDPNNEVIGQICSGHQLEDCMLYDFCYEVLEIKEGKELAEAYCELISNIGEYFLSEEVCLISARPSELYLNEDYEYYRENNLPVIKFRDGTSYTAQGDKLYTL